MDASAMLLMASALRDMAIALPRRWATTASACAIAHASRGGYTEGLRLMNAIARIIDAALVSIVDRVVGLACLGNDCPPRMPGALAQGKRYDE